MSCSADQMINYRKCDKSVRVAEGEIRSIEGFGDYVQVFRSGSELVSVEY